MTRFALLLLHFFTFSQPSFLGVLSQTARAIVRQIISFAERHESGTIYCVEGVPTQESVIKRNKMNFLTTEYKSFLFSEMSSLITLFR